MSKTSNCILVYLFSFECSWPTSMTSAYLTSVVLRSKNRMAAGHFLHSMLSIVLSIWISSKYYNLHTKTSHKKIWTCRCRIKKIPDLRLTLLRWNRQKCRIVSSFHHSMTWLCLAIKCIRINLNKLSTLGENSNVPWIFDM